MILQCYIFSKVSGTYQQYLTDNSETFLKRLCNDCYAPDQIAIHRDGNLMYYAYAHKKSESEIYGVGVVSGEICINLQWLYEYFQKTLDNSAQKGILFRYDEVGRITKNVDHFSTKVAEIDNIFRDIKEYVSNYPSYWETLPAEDFSVPLDSTINFAFNEDDKDKITDAIKHYHNVIVTMDSASPSSFAKTIERVNSEKNQLQEENNSLMAKVKSLSKQKKQYRAVITLSILVTLGVICIVMFNRNIKELCQEITEKDCSIDSLNILVSDKDIIIHNQTTELDSIKNNLKKVRDDLNLSLSLLQNVSSCMPICVSEIDVKNEGESYGGTIYSSKTTYIYSRLTVFSLIDGSVDLYIKFYTPHVLSTSSQGDSPKGYSYKDNVELNKNQVTSIYLNGWGGQDKGHWSCGEYRIEVWYKDVCIKAKTFTIN